MSLRLVYFVAIKGHILDDYFSSRTVSSAKSSTFLRLA